LAGSNFAISPTATDVRRTGSFSARYIALALFQGNFGGVTFTLSDLNAYGDSIVASVGDAYIIGPGAIGIFAGNDTKVAICEMANTFTIYAPAAGDLVYDISLGLNVQWNATTLAWQTATGQMKCVLTGFGSSGIFSKDARCVQVEVTVIGGSGGATNAGSVSGGGTSSFGSHCSATGGAAVNGVGVAANGSGSGGDTNSSGVPAVGSPAFVPCEFGAFSFGGSISTGDGEGFAGCGGFAWKVILAADLLANETVTVGPPGAGSNGGTNGQGGAVFVKQWILI
jgi:hypothetical protein